MANKTPAQSTKTDTKKPRLKLPTYQKTVKPEGRKRVSSAFRLFNDSVNLVYQHWKLFGKITLIYAALAVMLGVMASGQYINTWREDLNNTVGSETTGLGTGIVLFGLLVGSAGTSGTEGAIAYQSLIILIVSLAIIWALRHILAGEKVTLRDAFYKGMYPLIPYILVLVVIGLQLIPLVIATFLYKAAFGSGLAVGPLERVLWGVLVGLAAYLTIYMLSSSIFALYMVTLPDMWPMKALRSARELVRFRRFEVIRKLIFVPLALFVVIGVLTVPFLMFVPAIAALVFAVLAMLGVVVAHTYVYNLYRELL